MQHVVVCGRRESAQEHYMIEQLVGKTITEISGMRPESELVKFKTDDGEFQMYHQQSCCEGVSLYDITGDGGWLLGSPVLKAEESTNSDNPPENADSFTWTFYRISTIHGTVTLRWLGESNGYYGEEVEFEKVNA